MVYILKDTIKKSWIWAVILTVGIIVGIIGYKLFVPVFMPAILQTVDYIDKTEVAKTAFSKPFSLMIIIFLKNLSVAIICFFSAKISKGLMPGFIMLVNGIAIGLVGVMLSFSGMSVMSYVMGLIPHGIVELPALFLVCAIGMYGVNKESWRLTSVPALMLLMAAGIESYITPLIM